MIDIFPLFPTVVTGISGLKTSLPCNITPKFEDDSPALVLWYKDKSPTPIYTLDARKIPFDQARHSSVDSLASRAHVTMISNPPGSLELDPVIDADEGAYRCRVDFRRERTRYTDSKLKVIVLPGKPIISNENGHVLRSLIGPYNEGASLVLRCEAEGGNPSPSLTWWRESVLLDDTYMQVTNDRKVINELSIGSLQRHDLMAALSCQAKNNNISQPLISTVTVDMNFPPVCKLNQQVIYGAPLNEPINIHCDVEAEPPEVTFQWSFNDSKDVEDSLTYESNLTKSIATFTPRKHYHYGTLLCWGRNEVGSQTDPCAYKVIPTGTPQKPLSCTINNRTSVALEVVCLEGYSGGLNQRFIFEVYNVALKELVANFTASHPIFSAHGLSPGTLFLISVYSFNQKGRSEIWTTKVSTLLNSSQKIPAPEKDWFGAFKPVLVLLCAVSGGLVLVILIILLGVKFRRKQKAERKSAATNNGEENREESINLKTSGEGYTPLSMLDDERCPDLIPEMRSTQDGDIFFHCDSVRWPKNAGHIPMSSSRDSEQERPRPALDSFVPQVATVHGLSQESGLRVKVLPSSPVLRRSIPGEVMELAVSEERNTEV
ncbi:neural cell adhesion molecule 2-like isoform X4 [Limulus polyphemus]|uniref:Neural cell adhesion molecule 2-like isoform X4 n=1 Tax=Limulus polyphemus TaxID=6850 RepID=A0ABM1T5X8_LIMPO|nr:neural cell adhesion molecule 2-like isoform X4 [Limulus polyphemus]